MLYIETVEHKTFSLLTELMQLSSLNKFYLVGGTALSLKYGHRISIDIDLFTNDVFEKEILVQSLIDHFKSDIIFEDKPIGFGIFAYIKDIKTDIIHHPHSLIRPFEEDTGIRMFSTEDIVAMKVQAILGRGKKKDFWDVAELLQHYSVDDFIMFHKEKYRTQNLLITVPQALTYFADAEESEDPISLKDQSWEDVKQIIQHKVTNYLA